MSEITPDDLFNEAGASYDDVASEAQTADPEQPRSEQPRNDLGQYASTEETVTQDAPTDLVDTADTAPQVDEPKLLAGKYRTPEELEQGYLAAQSKLGELGNELGQWRQQAQQPAQQQQPRYDLSAAEEAVIENPGIAPQVALAALNQGDQFSYEKIVRAWHEVDPVGAVRFETWKSQQEHDYRLQQQMAPQMQQVQAYQARHQLESELETLMGRHDDAAQVLAAFNPEVNEIPQLIQAGLQVQDPSLRLDAWEQLYQHAKLLHGGTVAAHAQQAAAQTQQVQRQAKASAAVASASSAPVTESTGDQALDDFYSFMRAPSPTAFG